MTQQASLPNDLATDAVQALERFRFAADNGLLIQADWHKERGGRQLACMLGVLGREVDSPAKCPAQVMPGWLAKMVPGIFDRLTFEDAKAWGLGFYAQLARLNGHVPFSVIYDWQASSVLTFWEGSLKKRKFTPEALAEKLGQVEKLRALFRLHLAGGAAPKAEWREALRPLYAGAYAGAYADADADAYAYALYAYAGAYAYADALYADAYADALYAYASADASADAYADASADADAGAYADAYADAYAEPTPLAEGETKPQLRDRRRRENLKLLADGLVEAMSRVEAPESGQ